jgi:hypothetical protein
MPDPELGYIVAEAAEHAGFHAVRRFVLRPTVEEASRLCEDGTLWSSFTVARHASCRESRRALQVAAPPGIAEEHVQAFI